MTVKEEIRILLDGIEILNNKIDQCDPKDLISLSNRRDCLVNALTTTLRGQYRAGGLLDARGENND